MFFMLDDFEQRREASKSGTAIAAQLNQKLGAVQDAMVMVVQPPRCWAWARPAASS
jgi:multidrug efflux pump